jgi:hypothetical protein
MAEHGQAPPQPGVQDVTPVLIERLKSRAEEGLKTYGRPLQTFNGRSALQDALEEVLDLAQYLQQAVMEAKEGGVWKVKVASPVVCYDCGKLVNAGDLNHQDVIVDNRDGVMAFFCSDSCAGYSRPRLMPKGEGVEKRQPTSSCFGLTASVKANGYPSSLMVVCDRCGRSYDPTFPRVCPGPCDYGR